MDAKQQELRNQETEDVMAILYPEINVKPLLKKKALQIPPIRQKKEDTGADTAAPASSSQEVTPEVNEEDLGKALDSAKEMDVLKQELQELREAIQDLEREKRLQELKEDMRKEVQEEIAGIQKELDELKDRKIPERKEFETDGAYKEQLYPLVTNVLDKILIPLVNLIPDYNLVSTQISSTYQDGTIENGIVSVNIMMPYNDYRYDFKISVPILNGLIQTPSFVARGGKIIPLTQKDLYNELNTYSFRKLEVNNSFRKNPFTNTGENIHRKEDNQKFYETHNPQPQSVGLDESSKWKAFKQRGLI